MENQDEFEDDYEVGYGKPPKETQFQKGQSGNLKGRPPRERTVASIYTEIGSELVQVKVAGQTRTMTRIEAMLRQEANEGLLGNAKSRKEFITKYRQFEPQDDADEDFEEQDKKLAESLLERFEEARQLKAQRETAAGESVAEEPEDDPNAPKS